MSAEAAGAEVRGFRLSRGRLTPRDDWALEILAEEGFAYDSSMRPIRVVCPDGQRAPLSASMAVRRTDTDRSAHFHISVWRMVFADLGRQLHAAATRSLYWARAKQGGTRQSMHLWCSTFTFGSSTPNSRASTLRRFCRESATTAISAPCRIG